MYNSDQSFQSIQRNFAKLQGAYWQSPDFQTQLLANPKELLIANGIPMPETGRVNIVVNNATTAYLIIPQVPGNLSPDQISTICAEGTFGTAGSLGTLGTVCGTAYTFGSAGTFGSASL